jgi:phage terminase large subunit
MSLKHYRYEVDPETKRYSRKPLHDWASDAADSWRYFAVSMKTPRSKGQKSDKAARFLGELGQSLGWMG